MTPASEVLSNVFLFTFIFGLVFTLVSVFAGVTHTGAADATHGDAVADAGDASGHAIGHDAGDIGAHDLGDFGGHAAGAHTGGDSIGHDGSVHAGDGHAGAHGHAGPSVLNMPTIMAFLTWFGGAGYIFTKLFPIVTVVAVPLALVSGLVGGALMFGLLARVLWPMMSPPLARVDYLLPGTPARVVSQIRTGGVGEIVYTKAGSRFTTGAKSLDPAPVKAGTEVVIVNYLKGIAYVQPVQKLLDRDKADVAETVESQV